MCKLMLVNGFVVYRKLGMTLACYVCWEHAVCMSSDHHTSKRARMADAQGIKSCTCMPLHSLCCTVQCASSDTSSVSIWQSGMQEAQASEVELKDIEGSSLQAIVQFMYGRLSRLESSMVVPVFFGC